MCRVKLPKCKDLLKKKILYDMVSNVCKNRGNFKKLNMECIPFFKLSPKQWKKKYAE
jgi:hypothetical protein